jgi:general secretion pathway protein M
MIRLTQREQRFAIFMAAFVLVSAVYGLAIRPTRQRIATLERLIPDKKQELGQVQAKSREYLALRREFAEARSDATRQDPNFELPSFLESVVDRHQLTTRLISMQPTTLQSASGQGQTAVEISFEGIGMQELMAFLETLEKSDAPTTMGYVHIYHKEGRPAGLDAKIQILGPQHASNTVAAGLP